MDLDSKKVHYIFARVSNGDYSCLPSFCIQEYIKEMYKSWERKRIILDLSSELCLVRQDKPN